MGILTKLLLTVLTVLLVSKFVPGIEVDNFYTALLVAVVLAVFNLIVKPIVLILTLPINLLTLGLFTFVINAFLFWLASTIVPGFSVLGFIPAFIGSLIIALVYWFADKLID